MNPDEPEEEDPPSFDCTCPRCFKCDALLTQMEVDYSYREARVTEPTKYHVSFLKCSGCWLVAEGYRLVDGIYVFTPSSPTEKT